MKFINSLFAAIVFCAIAFQANAQIAEKKVLTLDGARKVIAAAEAEAKKLNATGGVIAVVDDGGNLMALERMDGTFAAGANISIGKARTAALFKRPTSAFEDIIKNGRTAMVALNDFTPLQGGVLIVVDGTIIGAVGVSGAASADQDTQLAVAGSNAFANPSMQMGEMKEMDPAVVFFGSDKVNAAFAKGVPLIEQYNYKIHASRREAAGMVEVHTKDTDLIYVLQGSATFITGGTMVDGKETAPNEIRGASIQGGETRELKKGDVIIVPNGTPHWFKQIKGPFLYYTVKVS